MDSNRAYVFENLTEGKVDWTKRIDDNVDIELRSINKEQEKVIHELEEVLSFLKGVQIANEEALENIKKPLDDLQSSLKYLPIESSFDTLPEEIKTQILSYLCDSGAFTVASVCREWKEIIKRRFNNNRQDEVWKVPSDPREWVLPKQITKDVKVGKHCSNYHECEDDSCFMPTEILKASVTHKLDIPLTICHPITEIDSKVITDGLLSVSNFTITGDCNCQLSFYNDVKLILSCNQLEDIIEGLEERVDGLEKVELIRVDMTGVNQDKLVDCLLRKVKWLTLDEGPHGDVLLDVETFVNKLKQMSTETELKRLTLHNFEYNDDCEAMADALCKVENVELCRPFPLDSDTLERLIDNILTRPIILKSLLIIVRIDFRALISPEDLRSLIDKMEQLLLFGFFSPEQLQVLKVARTLPYVNIHGKAPLLTLKKGRNDEDLYNIESFII